MKTLVVTLTLTLMSLPAMSPALSNEQTQSTAIATAGGTLTDIVYALEADERLVAVDSSSLYPPQASEKASIGYYRNLSAENVLAVRPDELWALEGTGNAQTLRQIERTGVTVRHFAKPTSVDELGELIHTIGALLDKTPQADALYQSIVSQLPPVSETPQLQALFILQASERGVVAAGNDTVPALLFEHAGVRNSVQHELFKPVSIEYLLVNQPDFLVAAEHSVEAAGGPRAFCNTPSLARLQAARQCNLLVMDSLLVLGMTTRIHQGITQIQQYSQQL